MKFQKLLMTGCRDMDKKHQKYHQDGVFPICDPQRFFFKNLAVTFVPLWCPNFMRKIRKRNNERSLSYLKTDGPRTDGQGRLLRTPSQEPGVQDIFKKAS